MNGSIRTCRGMLDDTHSSSALVVNLPATPRATSDPGLGDVDLRRVANLDPSAVDRLDLARRLEQLSVELAQAHAALGDGQITRLLEIVAHLAGHLLLGPLHLNDGVVERLAGDLTAQHDKLLNTGGQELALVQQLAFRRGDALVAGEAAATADQLDDLLALPAHAGQRIGIQLHGGVGGRANDGRGAGLGFAGVKGNSGFGVFDLVLEDAALGLVGELALEELLAHPGVVEL